MKKRISYFLSVIILTACTGTEQGADKNQSELTDSSPEMVDPSATSDSEQKYTYGVDISSNQGTEVSDLSPSDSLTFIICRATDGDTFQDDDFPSNWKTIKEKGFVGGAYHFYESDDAPEKQATNFIKTVGDLSSTDFPPMVDVENAGIHGGATEEGVRENLLSLLELLEKEYKRTPIVYTNETIGDKYMTDPEFAKYPLWIAYYEEAETPVLPGAWKGTEWQIWQRSDDYSITNGVKNDRDIFNGDREAFNAFLK